MRKGTSAQNHLASLVKGWRQKMSGKSVWNAYSSLSAFFRDAALADRRVLYALGGLAGLQREPKPHNDSGTSVAFPGLEPGREGSVEGRSPPSTTGPAEIPGGCAEALVGPRAVDGRLRPGACSNVARALRDLLEHAKRSGLDPAHPALRAAEAALKDGKKELR